MDETLFIWVNAYKVIQARNGFCLTVVEHFFSRLVTCELWQCVQGRSRRIPSRFLSSSAPGAVAVQQER